MNIFMALMANRENRKSMLFAIAEMVMVFIRLFLANNTFKRTGFRNFSAPNSFSNFYSGYSFWRSFSGVSFRQSLFVMFVI